MIQCSRTFCKFFFEWTQLGLALLDLREFIQDLQACYSAIFNCFHHEKAFLEIQNATRNCSNCIANRKKHFACGASQNVTLGCKFSRCIIFSLIRNPEKFGIFQCLGAIDGKHVHIVAPRSSGTLHHKYRVSFARSCWQYAMKSTIYVC